MHLDDVVALKQLQAVCLVVEGTQRQPCETRKPSSFHRGQGQPAPGTKCAQGGAEAEQIPLDAMRQDTPQRAPRPAIRLLQDGLTHALLLPRRVKQSEQVAHQFLVAAADDAPHQVMVERTGRVVAIDRVLEVGNHVRVTVANGDGNKKLEVREYVGVVPV